MMADFSVDPEFARRVAAQKKFDQKFKKKSPNPVTVDEARTLIKDFKKAELARSQQEKS